MLRFIKSHRGAKNKEFIGVIGNYFVEILDDDPFIPKFLSAVNSDYLHVPSDRSRFLTPDERMVLKSHEKNCLVIFKSEPHLEQYTCSIRLFTYDHPIQTPKELLTDAMRMAAFRWLKITTGDKFYSLNKSFMQPAGEILATLSSHKN
jgi:hypothetical protein